MLEERRRHTCPEMPIISARFRGLPLSAVEEGEAAETPAAVKPVMLFGEAEVIGAGSLGQISI